MESEGHKLNYYTNRANIQKIEGVDNDLFINRSLKQILHSISKTFIDIINEFLEGEAVSFRSALTILFKGDRMIYLGIVMIIIAFATYIADITN